MRPILALALLAVFALPFVAAAQDEGEVPGVFAPPGTTDLSEYKWLRRPVVVFADSKSDPRYIEQMEKLRARESALLDRDVVVLTDTDPEGESALRERLRPRGFALVLIGKDGDIRLRKPRPWSVRELTRSIDKMPMRQQELRERRKGGADSPGTNDS